MKAKDLKKAIKIMRDYCSSKTCGEYVEEDSEWFEVELCYDCALWDICYNESFRRINTIPSVNELRKIKGVE